MGYVCRANDVRLPESDGIQGLLKSNTRREPMHLKVHVIILNSNGLEDTLECL